VGHRRGAVETLTVKPGFWRGRRVFVTGHTGFKGSWLALWLQRLGAQVHGYALLPPTSPDLFSVAGVAPGMASHTIADLRDGAALTRAMATAAPEIVFHLAAQSLVRRSYLEPVETYAVNVLGTVNLFEAVRACTGVRAVVNVTTDKCYENDEASRPFLESDPLGGHDPYSSSKACAELVAAAYRKSFLAPANVALASARAGNVIGGGDWATDRLLPDFFRAVDARQALDVRHPEATRPWQHVLEPLAGYLLLAERLASHGERFASGWNFGPANADARTVRWVLDHLSTQLPEARWQASAGSHPHEAQQLQLDSGKASRELGWTPRWDTGQALDRTLEWHRAWRAGADMKAACLAQIDGYTSAIGP
jgi:CDP-glucose 4,6-dehydratase